LFEPVGNYEEQSRLFARALRLERERGNDHRIAQTLKNFVDTNQMPDLRKEWIQQTKKTLDNFERLGTAPAQQAQCLNDLAHLLYEDEQLDAAEEAALRTINLLPANGQEALACQSLCLLGNIYHSKGGREMAIHYFEAALGIASPFDWHCSLTRIHHALAMLLLLEDQLDDAGGHVEQANFHTRDNTYCQGRTVFLQAEIWFKQHRIKDAAAGAFRAIKIFEKVGAAKALEVCTGLLRDIERVAEVPPTPEETGFSGELPGEILCFAHVNPFLLSTW
jgi:tetratricopeptide (TPR) repeat protein